MKRNKTLAFLLLAGFLSCAPAGAVDVRFDANGGSVSPESVSVEAGEPVPTFPVPVRPGFAFLGWFDAPDGGSAVEPGFPAEDDTTLYARWAKEVYTIAFDANGGTGTMKPATLSYGKAAALPAYAFSRKGWTFIGWSRSAGGPVAWKNKATVKNLTENGGTVRLFAQWAKMDYKVAFLANGGTGKMAVQPMVLGKTANLSANGFVRSGFVFAGWAKTKAAAAAGKVSYRNEASVKNLVLDGSTVNLWAVWRKFAPKTPGRVRFALCQTPCGVYPASTRIEQTFAWARRNLRGNEDVIVFPELAFATFSELGSAWKKGPAVWKAAAAFARERGAWVLVNHPNRPDGGKKMFNETRVFAPDGSVVAVYRKRVLAVMDQKAGFKSGSTDVLAKLPFANLGLLICKDAFIPKKTGSYAAADLLLVQFAHPGVDKRKTKEAKGFPTSAKSMSDLRRSSTRWRKLGKPYMAVNKTGPDGNYVLCGGTFASTKSGTVVAKTDRTAKIVLVDFPLQANGRIKPVPSAAVQ